MPLSHSIICWDSGREWRFRLTADFVINLGCGWIVTHEFYDRGKQIGRLIGDELTIFEGYAWDGCSPAWRVFGVWIGTPTPLPALIPSLVHDMLYQFMSVSCVPWDKRQADEIFWNLMVEKNFPLKGTYHGAVAIFGAVYRRIQPARPQTRCLLHL